LSRLPVEQLPARLNALDLAGTEVHHLPDWKGYEDPKRLQIIRHIAMMRGRDPRIASLAVDIIRKAKVKPRDYKGQAAALLKWVQDPKNVYYVNEPGERLQDPIFTIKQGWGDCFAEDTLVLRADMELVPIQDVKVGDRIWGRDRWSAVVNTWEKGKLAVTEVCLNNGSVMRLTGEHKVYVKSCEKHGPACPDIVKVRTNCKDREFSWVRIRVAQLTEGMEILQPDQIEQPTAERWVDSEGAWLLGAFIAEGWAEEYRAMVSGKDGHRKEATKHRAKAYAESQGWSTRWDEKYLAINSREAVAFVAECGKGALNKRIPQRVLREGDLEALDEGLRLDASTNSRGNGWTLGTVSSTLAVQYRVLQRMLGRSTSTKLVTDHGGFGNNPIYRVGVRNPTKNQDRRLRVQAIHREVNEVPCYDIATDDHYVYLPEADATVSNCDDQILVLTALFESIRLPWKLVLGGTRNGKKIRFIEGSTFPKGCKWAHIYCMVGTPPFKPTKWYYCETTVQGVPLGWDVISGHKSYLPEMDTTYRGKPRIVKLKRASRRFRSRPLPAADRTSPAYQMAYGGFQPSQQSTDYGQSALSPIGAAVGASMATEIEPSDWSWDPKWTPEQKAQATLLDVKKILPAVITGVVISVGTQLILDWVRPHMGLRKAIK
jgi:hypothetical protein